jgi:CPA1 family monovalent cation:H+ antiporter
MTSQDIILTIELIVILLSIAAIVGIIARRLRMPYTVGLVLVGFFLFVVINWSQSFSEYGFIVGVVDILDEFIHLDPDVTREIILGLLVPPLIFEAAFNLRVRDLLKDWKLITTFAIPGVLITTLLVGFGVYFGVGIPLTAALVFGALIAATDPVAVVALFKSLGVPKRLQVLLEGESLFNDGTAIVIFGIALELAQAKEVTLLSGFLDFLLVAGGGILVGIIVGFIISRILTRLDDYLIETALTFILAYGVYFLAENIHVSGVLAVVAAGLVNGSVGPQSMSPTTRIVVSNFWEFAAFIANSLIFLLIGLVVDPVLLFQNWQAILVAILAVLAARAIVIFGFSSFSRSISFRWKTVLFWGGLRGAISLALALGLGAQYAQLRAMTFGVVIFTLLIQGTTMGGLVKRLKLNENTLGQNIYMIRQARAAATQAAHNRINTLRNEGLISNHTFDLVDPVLRTELFRLRGLIRGVLEKEPEVAADELDMAWREALRSERSTINTLLQSGMISEDNYEKMISQIDLALDKDMINWESAEEYHQDLDDLLDKLEAEMTKQD